MLLRSRPATLDDLLAARESLAFAYGDDPALRERLPEAWARMLALPGVEAFVVEDAEAPADRRAVYHSMTAFVSDGFAARLASGNAPFIGGQLARRLLEAGDEPLSEAAIVAGSAGEGLNGVNVHSVCLLVPPGTDPPLAIGEHVAARSFEAMRGYRFRSSLRDVFGPDAARSYGAGGWRLRTDNGAASPSIDRPHVLGITRHEAAEATGARMATLFVEHPRRLGLRATHRELLEPALRGLSDEEIAGRLGISVSAVKKRWLAAYEHVDARLPGLLPFDPARAGRGVERRRHLLAFLRERPEEMRPLPD